MSEFVTLLGGAATGWPLAARAVAGDAVAGVLDGGSADSKGVLVSFRQGLAEAGYVEGQNVVLEYRSAHDRWDQLPELAAILSRAREGCLAPRSYLPATNRRTAGSATARNGAPDARGVSVPSSGDTASTVAAARASSE